MFQPLFEIQALSALTLFMLRVLADHTDLTLSLDDLAFFADRFY